MALDRSPEFKIVIVQIVCVVHTQSDTAWALTNITSGNTCHAKFHASEASGSEEDFDIFLCISLVLGPLFEQTTLSTTRQCYISNFKTVTQGTFL